MINFVTCYIKDSGYKKVTNLKMNTMRKNIVKKTVVKNVKHNPEDCGRARLALQDTIDIVGGKWKLVLISTLRDGKLRFRELSRKAGISPRILSKELHELEMNGLVNRKVCDTKPITVEYSLTKYSETLKDVIYAMHKWGVQHRKTILKSEKA